MTKATGKRRVGWLLLGVYLLLLAFNFMTPMIGDDFAHYYDINGGGHIDSPGEILSNLDYLRQHVNGRVLAHLAVYLMQIPPRAVFRVLNAAVLPLLLWLMLGCLPEEARFRPFWLGMGAMLLWLFLPSFGEVFLWLTGSCNYGWCLLLLFAALRPFVRSYLERPVRRGLGRTLLMLLLSFLAGAYSESGAIALLAAEGLFLLLLLCEKRLRPELLLFFAAALGGFAFLLFMPATLGTRTGEMGLHGLAVGLKNVVAVLRAELFPLYALFAGLFALVWAQGERRRVLRASLVLAAAGLVSGLSLAAAAYFPGRTLFALAAFTVLACLLLLAELCLSGQKSWTALVAGLTAAAFLFAFAAGAGDILSLYAQSRERAGVIARARTEGAESVTLREYVTNTGYSALADEGMAEAPDDWYNNLLALYYGFDEVYGEIPFD